MKKVAKTFIQVRKKMNFLVMENIRESERKREREKEKYKNQKKKNIWNENEMKM